MTTLSPQVNPLSLFTMFFGEMRTYQFSDLFKTKAEIVEKKFLTGRSNHSTFFEPHSLFKNVTGDEFKKQLHHLAKVAKQNGYKLEVSRNYKPYKLNTQKKITQLTCFWQIKFIENPA